MEIRHILLTTDLSKESLRAFPVAADLARRNGARLTLLSVVHAAEDIARGAPFAPPLHSAEETADVREARAFLAEKRPLLGEGIEVAEQVVVAGDIGEAIAACATEQRCDLIVLSTHGRSGLRRLVLGSVAELVLRHSHVPVLCVPPPPA